MPASTAPRAAHLVDLGTAETIEVLGSTIQYLTAPDGGASELARFGVTPVPPGE